MEGGRDHHCTAKTHFGVTLVRGESGSGQGEGKDREAKFTMFESTHNAAVEDPASKAALQIPPNLAAHHSSDRYVTIVGIYRDEPKGPNE